MSVRLAGPVLADERVDLAALQGEVDPVEDLASREPLAHLAHGEERRAGSRWVLHGAVRGQRSDRTAGHGPRSMSR